MSEDTVDVTWRGQAVVRQARLLLNPTGTGFVEHAAPMPTGTAVTLRTADGHELAAVVATVREQISGRSEPPGMEVAVAAAGEASAWWQARVATSRAAAVAAPSEPARPPRSRTTPPAQPAPAAPTPALEVAAPTPALEAAAAAVDARATDVMPAVVVADADADADAAAASATDGAAADAADAASDAIPETLADDGRRTTVMAVVDIEAIVAASADAAPAEVVDEPSGPTAGGDKKKGARGKRRRGR
ncbi:MAG: hypothetical protein R3B06_06415 [Kofleriaceae bacterium]